MPFDQVFFTSLQIIGTNHSPGEKDKQKKAKEYKHMTFYEAARLAKEAEVKEMWLTHYSPSLNHPEEFLGDVREIFPNTVTARDGRTMELVFSDDK